MTRFHALLTTIAVGAATVVLAAGQQSSTAAGLFQQGLLLERAEGNVAQAIVIYERVIAEYPADTTVLPQVLRHLAETYERRNDARAVRMWSRLATDFGTTSHGAAARQRLAASEPQAGPFRSKPVGSADAPLDVLGFSPDGQSVAFRKRPNGGDEIWVRDIDSGRDRRLSQETGRAVENATWSPDSRRLSLVTSPTNAPQGSGPTGWDLRVLASQGGASRTVATAATGRISAYWSPDNRWVFADIGFVVVPGFPADISHSESRLIDAITGESRKLTVPRSSVGGPVWSRDGRQVAFQTADTAGSPSLWVTAVEAGDVRPWTTPLGGRVNLAPGVTRFWTTDNRILVRQQEAPGFSFYLVPATGGPAEKTCTSMPGAVQCSRAMTPDGKIRVAEDSAAKRLMLFDVGKLDVPRRATTGYGSERSPNLSPDGRLLAFASNADGHWALYVVPVDRAPVEAVRVAELGASDNASDITARAWTPSGRLVAEFISWDSDVYRINMDRHGRGIGVAGRLTQDTRMNGLPAVSPDSDRIAYAHESGLAVMTADGGGERPVLQARTQGLLQWRSADEVLFSRVPEGGNTTSISALNVKTGAVQTVIDLPAGSPILWQYVPSRNEIFYSRRGVQSPGTKQVIHARSIGTGADRVVAEVLDLSTHQYAFRVSPDGTQIAYGRFVYSGAGRHTETHLMSVDGQGDRVLSKDGTPYDWSPDGRFLLRNGEVKGLTYVMVTDVRSGESWPIEQAPDSDKFDWGDVQWASNGSFIVLSRAVWGDDLRVFDGVTYDAVVKLMGPKH